MTRNERHGPTTFLWAGLVLLFTAVAVMACALPLVPCPNGDQQFHDFEAMLREKNARGGGGDGPHCFRCKDRARVTLLSAWMKGRDPQ